MSFDLLPPGTDVLAARTREMEHNSAHGARRPTLTSVPAAVCVEGNEAPGSFLARMPR